MRRWGIWAFSAVVTMVSFTLARLADVPAGLDLLIAFLGAIAGTAIGTEFSRRRWGEEEEKPKPPRRQGSGRRAK